MVNEVGIGFAAVAPVGVNERLFVRFMVRICPVGTVITTGDQPYTAGVVVVAGTSNGAFGFNALQVAVARATAVPHW
jgi:hypothetical protein